MEDRIAHLMSSFLCFFEHIFVFLFKFLVLSSTAIEINFLFIAQMGCSLLFDWFLTNCGGGLCLFVKAIVIFSLPKNLNNWRDTWSILDISSFSMREDRKLALAVLRSLTSLSLPWL